MRAILINSVKRTVTEIDYTGPYTEIYKLLSTDLTKGKVSTFECVTLADGDAIFVDGEGIINGLHDHGFAWQGYHQPLAGNAVIIGTGSDGESADAKITLEEVKRRVAFNQWY